MGCKEVLYNMKKSKDHIKRFLSSFRPAAEQDEHLIRLFLNKRKIKVPVPEKNPDYESLDSITYEQFESWYNAGRPVMGDIVKSSTNGSICLVVHERWDSLISGAILSSENILTLKEQVLPDDTWVAASEDEIRALQKALAGAGYDWNPYTCRLITREIPHSPRYVRLMVVGEQVGIGIFKSILYDNTLEMVCVKMRNAPIRCDDDLNLGDADHFSFFDTYDEHRAIIQQELAQKDLIWNVRCRRLEKNSARAKEGGSYFWVSSFLEIKQATESSSVSDKRRFNRGNYFLKRSVALRARDRIINVCKEEMMSEDNA